MVILMTIFHDGHFEYSRKSRWSFEKLDLDNFYIGSKWQLIGFCLGFQAVKHLEFTDFVLNLRGLWIIVATTAFVSGQYNYSIHCVNYYCAQCTDFETNEFGYHTSVVWN